MPFIAKNPINSVALNSIPNTPIPGTRSIFPMNDGWYEMDSDGNVRRLGADNIETITLTTITNNTITTSNELGDLRDRKIYKLEVEVGYQTGWLIVSSVETMDKNICQTLIDLDGSIYNRYHSDVSAGEEGWSDWSKYISTENIDTALSETSTNPVQNKVVAEAFKSQGIQLIELDPNGSWSLPERQELSNISTPGIYKLYFSSAYEGTGWLIVCDHDDSPTNITQTLIDTNATIYVRRRGYEYGDDVNAWSAWIEYITKDVSDNTYLSKTDASTTYSTKEELVSKVDEEITKIINGAPEALDTLNELAKALGDDPNFAATIITELDKKANDTDLHAVAKSGDYGDLNNVPIIHYEDGSSDRPTSLNSLRETGVYVFSGTLFNDITDDNWYSNNGFSTWGRYRITVNKDHETGATALVSQWIECNNSLLLRTFNFEFNDPTPFNIKETPLIINGVSVAKKEVDNLKDIADTTYATKESVIPKISLWQPNTSYEVGNVVLASDPDGYHYTAICISKHISSNIDSMFMGDTGYWNVTELKTPSSLNAKFSLEAEKASADANGNYIDLTYATKTELRPTPITDTSSAITVNNSYNYGEQTELSIALPTTANDGDVVYITFTSGATATVLTLDTTNTSDIELIPEANTGYEIYAKYNGTIWIVNYSDYTVTAEAGA